MSQELATLFHIRKRVAVLLHSPFWILGVKCVFWVVFLVKTNEQESNTIEVAQLASRWTVLLHHGDTPVIIKSSENETDTSWIFHLVLKISWEIQIYSALSLAIIGFINSNYRFSAYFGQTKVPAERPIRKYKLGIMKYGNRASGERGRSVCWQLKFIENTFLTAAWTLHAEYCGIG